MIRPDTCNRRDLLRAGVVGSLGLGQALGQTGLAGADSADPRRTSTNPEVRAILLVLNGGPSQLDTWDPKPEASEAVRGPFRAIPTNVPGISISEHFPKLARIADKVAIVRSIHSEAPPVHDAGHQLIQTGRIFVSGVGHPHMGSVLAYLRGPSGDAPPHVLASRPIGKTGGVGPHSQSAGDLGETFDPVVPESEAFGGHGRKRPGSAENRAVREAFDLSREPSALVERYGRTRFGRALLRARRLIERGVRFVTVNQFETVFDTPSWDCHGSKPFSAMDDLARVAAPSFDAAYSALLTDLDSLGLLDGTIVLAVGEFGRTPRINAHGGRDHHPGCWSGLFAGGPIRGGQVVGASDSTGHAPIDRPVTPAEVVATVYRGLGLDLDSQIPGPDSCPVRIVDAGVEPIHELF